jgi:chitin synthase
LQFLVIIIVDGREKMSKTVLEYCETSLKLWNSDLIELQHDGNAVTCHMFEKTIILPKHASQNENFSPLQVAFVVKEKNGGKLNSHLWYFSGLVRLLNPEFCVVSRWHSTVTFC